MTDRFAFVGRLLAPPLLEKTEETRRAFALYYLLLGLTALVLLPVAVALLLDAVGNPLYLVQAGITVTANLVLLIVLREGRTGLVSILLCVEFFFGALAATYAGGTLNGPLAGFLLLPTLLAGLLIGNRAAAAFAVLSTLALFFMLRLEQAGLLPPTAGEPAALYHWLIQVSMQGFVLPLIVLANHTRSDAMKSAFQNQRELRKANEELQSIRHSLEETVQERTHSANAARQQAEAAHQAMAEQAWLATGQALLSERTRGDLDIPTLAHRIIQHLCQYVEAPMGAIFLADEEERLQLTASYAYERRKHWLSRFRPGEGLVGQAALEKKSLLFTQLPEQYTPLVTSGLLTAAPHCLLVMPFLYEKEVVGVVEIAFLEEITPLQEQFLENVLETLAVTFAAAQSRTHMNRPARPERAEATTMPAGVEE